MNSEQQYDDPIELGTGSSNTRSGPFGVDEHQGGLFVPVAGLIPD